MRRFLFLLALASAAWCAHGEIQVIDGVRYECSGGLCRRLDDPAPPVGGEGAAETGKDAWRVAEGYMNAPDFIAFLRGEAPQGGGAGFLARARGFGVWVLVLAVILAGLAMNLTPCVLPMVPVNLMVIGRSAARGLAYGAGMALAYGALGAAAAFGGLAFGTIQASAAFNFAVALVFVALGLSLAGVWTLDFTRFRPVRAARPASGAAGLVGAFALGVVAAVLAGACVAPALVAVLVLAADGAARGETLAPALPFLFGLGMALPWPLAGAGLSVLPKPGAWMRHVNRVFALIVFGFALWHGALAVNALRGTDATTAADGVRLATPETFAEVLIAAPRPVLVDCTASWCKNCAAMDRVLADPEVRKALKGHAVIRLQAEDFDALRRIPGFAAIRGLPAFAVITAGDASNDSVRRTVPTDARTGCPRPQPKPSERKPS